jgi:hypothetical protein
MNAKGMLTDWLPSSGLLQLVNVVNPAVDTGAYAGVESAYPPLTGTEAEAPSCEVALEHTVAGVAEALSVMLGTTVTACVLAVEQPFWLVPVTVYETEALSVATTVAPVVTSRPVEGDQVYESAPEAVRVTLPLPLQIPAFGGLLVMDTDGDGFTLMVTVSLADAPQLSVTVTV